MVMFSLLGKKEVIGTTFWLAPLGLSIMGYARWSPYRAIEAIIATVVVIGAVVSIGNLVRFVLNYLRGPRIALG